MEVITYSEWTEQTKRETEQQIALAKLQKSADEILEFPLLINFPIIGEENVLYLDKSTGRIYSWNVSQSKYLSSNEGSSYTLPVATDTILGGIKVGSNLSITDGVLSSVHPSITINDNTTDTSILAYDETFSVIDSITTDTNGHISSLNIKTLTMPSASSGGTSIDENILKIDTVNSYVGINQLVPTKPLDVHGGANFTAPDFYPFIKFPQSSGHEPQQYMEWGQVKVYQAHLNSLFLKPKDGDNSMVGLGLTPTGNARGSYLTCEATDIHYGNPGFGLLNVGINPDGWFNTVLGVSASNKAYAMITVEQHSTPDYPITQMMIGEDEGSNLEAIHFGFSNFSIKPLKITKENEVEVNGYYKTGELLPEPADPAVGETVTWVSSDIGTEGDVMMKINVSGAVKTVTLVDFSAV